MRGEMGIGMGGGGWVIGEWERIRYGEVIE